MKRSLYFILPLLLFFLTRCGEKSKTIVSIDPVREHQVYGTAAQQELAVGATEKFRAIVSYDDKHWEDKSSEATWSTNLICPTDSDPGTTGNPIATVSSEGIVTGVNKGIVYIVAKIGTYTGCSSITVSGAALVSIEVTPALPSSPAGIARQFTATGIYADGTTSNLTSSVNWSSSTTSIATIVNTGSQKGQATGVTPGVTTIIATYASISGSTVFTVTSALLVSLAVTPVNPSIPLGLTKQFTATGTYSNGTTQDITASVAWSSSDVTVATVAASGLASSLLVGSTTIQASIDGTTATSILTVTAATLASLAVTPANPSIALGLTKQFTATGTYTDNSTQDLTASATWSSSDTAIATISNAAPTNGLAQSVAVGSTTISASYGGYSDSTTLTVTSASLVSIAVTPALPSIAKGRTKQFTATGTYTDSSTQDITTSVLWSTSNAAIATVSNASGSQGLATGAGVGTATITATSGAVSSNTDITVTPAVLDSIAVTPQGASIVKTQTRQYTATGTYSDNSTVDLTTTATWTSSSNATATISNGAGTEGLATGVAVGFVRFTATIGTVHASANATVTP